MNNAINHQLVQDFFHQQYFLQILLKKHLNYEPPACDKKRHEGSLEGSWCFGQPLFIGRYICPFFLVTNKLRGLRLTPLPLIKFCSLLKVSPPVILVVLCLLGGWGGIPYFAYKLGSLTTPPSLLAICFFFFSHVKNWSSKLPFGLFRIWKMNACVYACVYT